MVAPWPKAAPKLIDDEAEQLFERFRAVTVAIRNTKAELNVPLDCRPQVRLASVHAPIRRFFEAQRLLLQALASIGDVQVESTRQRVKHAAVVIVDGIEVLIPLEGLIDTERERQRLQSRAEELTQQLAQVDARLKDKQFTGKAPKEVVEQTKARRAQLQDTLKKFSHHLAILQSM